MQPCAGWQRMAALMRQRACMCGPPRIKHRHRSAQMITQALLRASPHLDAGVFEAVELQAYLDGQEERRGKTLCAPLRLALERGGPRTGIDTCKIAQAPVQPGVPPAHARLAAPARARRAGGPGTPGPRQGRPRASAHAATGADRPPGQCAFRCHACHDAHALSLVHESGQPACIYRACVTLSVLFHEAVQCRREHMISAFCVSAMMPVIMHDRA